MLKKALLLCLALPILSALMMSCKDNDSPPSTDSDSETSAQTTTGVSEDDPNDAWKADYNSKQLINDSNFENGFYITQEDPRAFVGPWRTTASRKKVAWSVAQWGTFYSYSDRSGHQCLWGNDKNPADNILENNINKIVYNSEEKSLELSMNSYEFYGGQPHTDDSFWPHLLIEQSVVNLGAVKVLPEEKQKLYSLAADKIILELDIRMTNFSHEKTGGTMACQFLSYYYITSTQDSGFTWFGVPLFDDRGFAKDEEPTFITDTGSGLYMYCIPQYEVYKNSTPNGGKTFFHPVNQNKITPSDEWVHIEIDMKPWLEEMAKKAMGTGGVGTYPNTTDLSQLYISGLNLGFELHGTYDVTFEIKNYKITSYVKK